MLWVSLIRWMLPYAISAGVGFVAAWGVQGLRIGALKNDVRTEQQKLADYKINQREAAILAAQDAEKRRKETINEWTAKLVQLEADHDTYKRCVAAGKCGVRFVRVRDVLPAASGAGVQPACGADAARPDTVPAPGEVAAEDAVLKDCARTTLQINQLQADVEKQKGPAR